MRLNYFLYTLAKYVDSSLRHRGLKTGSGRKLRFCNRRLLISDRGHYGYSQFLFWLNYPKMGNFSPKCCIFDQLVPTRGIFFDRLKFRGAIATPFFPAATPVTIYAISAFPIQNSFGSSLRQTERLAWLT